MARNRATNPAPHNEAVALARAGRHRDAQDVLLARIREEGESDIDPRTLKALWQIARHVGDFRTALAAGFRAATRDPLDFRFVDRVMQSLAECPQDALVDNPAASILPLPAVPPPLSIVIPSRDDARYDDVASECDRAFAQWPHERIRISDATSMVDAWTRGVAESRGEIVVFAHDDIRFAIPDFAARLARAMAAADVVGVAGTTRVCGPALLWSGHPHLAGAITHRDAGDAGYEFALLSLRGPWIADAQALDGVFIAARREWIERVGFDRESFTGFHFYDLDFSFRAHQQGARVAIAADLALIHRSRGPLTDDWRAAQAAFARKFPELSAPSGTDRHWHATRLPDVLAVREHCAKLCAAWELPLA